MYENLDISMKFLWLTYLRKVVTARRHIDAHV